MLQAQKIVTNTQLLADLVQLTKDAGDAILEIYHSDDFGIESKADASPVTTADLAAHHFLMDGLKHLTPHIPVVSEEDADSLNIPHYNSCYWLIDPLDGTKEFINKNGEFTVNLALIENKKPSFGLVGEPITNTIYWGGMGLGAFQQQGQAGTISNINCVQPQTPKRILASKSHLNDSTKKLIDTLGPVTLIQAGSSLKFIRIAQGLADYYPRLAPTCEWDTAAAQAVLEGAGGSVTQASGEAMVYGKTDILNPHFIAQGKVLDYT